MIAEGKSSPTARAPKRRQVMLGSVALAGGLVLAGDVAEGHWADFRQRFLRADGRIVDTGNAGVSHSEGQGVGLVFAAAANDRPAFEAIAQWTAAHLRRPGDPLHAWRWRPDAAVPVSDPNNASDGDLLIAWGLLRGAARWGNAGWRQQGIAIGRALLDRCTAEANGLLLLRPGLEGFLHGDHLVVNPAYYVLPAMAALAEALPDPRWGRLRSDGLALLRQARFGRWGLSPDWLQVPRGGGRPLPASEWPARFSWDAIRVPLYLAWGGEALHPAVTAAASFWHHPEHLATPAWVDLNTGALAPYPANAGILAISRLVLASRLGHGMRTRLPAVAEAPDYYSASLVMLARLALADLPDAPLMS